MNELINYQDRQITLDEVFSEILEAREAIPFGNSRYQIEQFILQQGGEGRNYRQVLLEMDGKRKALQSCRNNRARTEIDIEEIEYKLNHTNNNFEKRRLNIDLYEKKQALKDEEKLIRDCLLELETMYRVFKSMKPMTREVYEESERGYWEERLNLTAKREIQSTGRIGTGTMEAMEKIGLIEWKPQIEAK